MNGPPTAAETGTRLGAAMDVRYAATVEGFLDYITDLGLEHVEFKREYLAGHPEAPTPAQIGDLASTYDVSVTLHAPFRDWNAGSFNAAARRDSVDRVRRTLDDAAAMGADAVVVHGGSVPERYPEWVRDRAIDHARRSLREAARHAERVGVPLCLENQPPSSGTRRHTTTPDDLAALLEAADADPQYLGVTLDVGHAAVAGFDPAAFIDRFGDRIQVCHLHNNDGTADQHHPLTDYQKILTDVPADYASFEMKSVADVGTCVGASGDPDIELGPAPGHEPNI
jgi:sugar phosphate isomerase/epimerase